jgi:signal peptidase I
VHDSTENGVTHDGDGLEPSPSLASRTSADETPKRPRRGSETLSFIRWLAELVVLLAVAWVLALGIKTYVVQPFIIPSSSMEDTLLIGDRVLVSKFAYREQDPRPGDIVVFVSSEDGRTDLIKRVVAVGGQEVSITDGTVTVDGRAADDSYVNTRYPDTYTADATVTVPAGCVYVMGDNRPNSKDSRYIGPQPLDRILGRAFAIYWPLDRMRTL